MGFTQRLSEALAIVATVDPDAYTTGTQGSDSVDMMNHNRVMFVVMAGALGSSATLDAKVQYSDAGTSWTDYTGKAITQLTDAGTDSDKQAVIEVTSEELAATSATARYLRLLMTIGTATSDCGAVVLADCSRHSPASAYDLATVDEIVA